MPSVIFVTPMPAPTIFTALLMVSVFHVPEPAGTFTVSPTAAVAIAAATSACEGEAALTTPVGGGVTAVPGHGMNFVEQISWSYSTQIGKAYGTDAPEFGFVYEYSSM